MLSPTSEHDCPYPMDDMSSSKAIINFVFIYPFRAIYPTEPSLLRFTNVEKKMEIFHPLYFLFKQADVQHYGKTKNG
jgi:hypothetical protein